MDGVRAIAVLSVLAYHLQLPWMRGGFLGVDAFFVLSGYLITGLLLTEHAAFGGISLANFWARRARRLFPALLLVIVVVALGVRTLRPVTEWPAKTADLVWTLLYGANWHQVTTSQDYFAQWRSISPLRHMWSIAIEEQFYLVWPLVMTGMLRSRARRLLLPGIVVAALASAIAMWVLFDPGNPTRAYVGTDTRAQQLLIGAALAVLMHRFSPRVAKATSAVAWIGGVCGVGVAVALCTFPDASPLYYRGGALVLAMAVAGVLWSIETAPRSVLARVLGVGPLSWLGRISYGLYLWHWPVIVFTPTMLVRLFARDGLAFAEHRFALNALCVGLALFCAVVSYYAVEQPIRRGRLAKFLMPERLALASVVAGCAVFFVVRSTLAVPPALLGQVMTADIACRGFACPVIRGGPGRPVMAVMGDSVALSLGPAFAQVARAHSWTFVQGAHYRCTVLQHWVNVDKWEPCYDNVPVIQREVLSFNPTLIVVSDNWLPVDAFDDGRTLLTRGSPEHVADIERRMGPLIEELTAAGALLVVMRLVDASQGHECLEPAFATAPQCQGPPPDSPRVAPYNAMFDRLARRYPDRMRVIDLGDVVCPNNLCTPKVDGIILRSDSLHFSIEGARWVAPHLERKLIAAGVKLDL